MPQRPASHTLGLLGGASWVSTVEYYRLINEGVHQALGGDEYARCVIYSFNLGDILDIQRTRDWPRLTTLVATAAARLVSIGAEALVLCSGTLHEPVDRLSGSLGAPVLHIADATADRARALGIDRLGLLGSRFTMEMDYYTSRLERRGLTVAVPGDAERDYIQRSITEELARGVFTAPTRQRYLDIIGALGRAGAQGVIMGCTEIPLLLRGMGDDLPLLDSTALHASAAVQFAVS